MKNMKKVLGLGIVLASFATAANAQTGNFETATANAYIVEPISITELRQLDFGKLSVHGSNAGTAKIDSSSTGVRSVTAGVTGVTGGSEQSGEFKVVGEDGYTFVVTLPGNSDVELSHSITTATKMPVVDFTTDHDPLLALGSGTNNPGEKIIHVGATLQVSGGQLAGTYSGTYIVAVDYN